MRLNWLIILGMGIFALLQFGPEFFRYNAYKIYKEIQLLKDRVERLENER